MMAMRSVTLCLSYVILLTLEAKTTLTTSEVPEVTCPRSNNEINAVWIRHQLECSNFYQCDNNDVTPSLLLRCPPGTMFDDGSQEGCTKAEEINCAAEISTKQLPHTSETINFHCPNDSAQNYIYLLQNQRNCSQFFRCYQGKSILYECPSKMYFDPVFETCGAELHHACERTCQDIPEPECPSTNDETVLLQHPTDCNAFYQCNWGTPLIIFCSPGLYFNPITKTCDWPANVECNRC